MNYEENMVLSVIMFFTGLFLFGIVVLPLSYYFAHRANRQRPTESLPVIMQILVVVLFLMKLVFFMVILL